MVCMGRQRTLGDGRGVIPPVPLRQRVEELVAVPGYGALLGALRSRLEAGGQPGTVTLRGLDAEARRALADVLGRRKPPGVSARIRIADIDDGLRSSRVGAGLLEVLEAAGGPLVDRRAQRAEAQASWDGVWEAAAEHPAASRAAISGWLTALQRTGVLRRLVGEPAAASELLERALDVVERLPERGVALSVLAAEATGDAHALDHGEPLATLVLGAAARIAEVEEVPPSARARRSLWAQVGVACDPLSVSVLVFGLRLDGGDIFAGACNDHASHGEPLRLTLRQLTMAESLRSPSPRVLVCENPAVVSAAVDALDSRELAAPLVCVDGIPDVAADRLLQGLADGGSSLAFHADFDWGGVRIGNLLTTRYGAAPWRFTAAEYRAAVAEVAVTRPLKPSPAEAAWDPALAPAMRTAGQRIAEEQVLDSLLTDIVS